MFNLKYSNSSEHYKSIFLVLNKFELDVNVSLYSEYINALLYMTVHTGVYWRACLYLLSKAKTGLLLYPISEYYLYR